MPAHCDRTDHAGMGPFAHLMEHLHWGTTDLEQAKWLVKTYDQEVQEVVRDAVQEAEHKRRLEEPILRNCLFPGCLRQFDINATMTGRPVEANRSAEGWRQVRPTVATGYVCPDHAPLMGAHRPRWDDPATTPAVLRCSCGWASPDARWQGYATAAWQDHLVTTEEA